MSEDLSEVLARAVCRATTCIDPDSRPLTSMTVPISHVTIGPPSPPTFTFGRPEWERHLGEAEAIQQALRDAGYVIRPSHGGARFGKAA